jgi:hypothetical protein
LKVSHSSGSSTQKRPPEQRGRGLIQNESDLLDTDLLPIRTAVENPPVVCEAAPTGCPVVICFASCIGSSRTKGGIANSFSAAEFLGSRFWIVSELLPTCPEHYL